MKALARASRVNSALKVIQRMNNGMTIVDACREVGVPRSTFYDICQTPPRKAAQALRVACSDRPVDWSAGKSAPDGVAKHR